MQLSKNWRFEDVRDIPKRTQQEMYLFFLKTSAPRIAAKIEQERKEKESTKKGEKSL